MTAIELSATSLDASVLLGDWRNTNQQFGIQRIVCSEGDPGHIDVQCFGYEAGRLHDWGTVSAPLFAFTFDSHEAGAFRAVFPLDNETVYVQANVKAGVLVVATFNEVRDRSGRNNFFDREFFHRTAM